MLRRVISLLLLLCVSQGALAFEEELQFVKGLTEEGFPKLAEKVLFRTLEKYPEASSAAPELRIRILIADKKFPEASTSIVNQQSAIVNTEALWLFLAENAAGEQKLKAYRNYFALTKAPDAEAAFHYGTLLEERGDEAAAIQLYERVDSRPTKSRLAALLIESDPDRALQLAEEVQLGGLDLWFGNAVVTWAQIMIDRSEWSEAQAVLETELELLKSLRGSTDPIAGARYLLGTCYEHENKKAKALHQFYNVYAKYGDTPWGPKAQEKAEALITHFERQGKTVKIDLGANLAKMEESTFRVARRLFFDRQYAEAIPIYLDALNAFPEGTEAITALRELASCAIQLNDELLTKTIAHYLSERFAAGDALLAIGKTALDQTQETLAWWIYDLYLKSDPTHPRAPAVLFSLAGLRKQESYLFQLLENYPDSPYHARALGRLAWIAYADKDYETAAARFAPYVDTETDPQKQTRARFALAESYRNLAQQNSPNAWKNALESFQGLEKAMADAANSYGTSKETLEFNQPFHEKAVYYQAVCQKELGELDAAVQLCEQFEEQFPRSGILEQVRFTKAKTLIESDRFAEALIALEGLDEKFAEPACYYRGLALFETGAHEESVQTLETFLLTWPASELSYEAIFVQGRAQTDPAEKLASFQRVALLADPEDHAKLIADALFESLPLHLELNRPDDLLADSDRLLAEFPTLGKIDEIDALKKQAQQKIKELKNEPSA